MSENFAEMLANEEWKEIHTGEVVDGTVIAVKEDQIVLTQAIRLMVLSQEVNIHHSQDLILQQLFLLVMR